MSRFGFVGPTYQLQSVNADAQRCINWYPEQGGADSRSALQMLPTPGLSRFAGVNSAAQVRGQIAIAEGQTARGFTVIDAQLYEVLASGVLNPLGNVGNDGNPASMAASPQQLLVASAGLCYVYQLQTQTGISQGNGIAGTFIAIPAATFPNPVLQVAYCDGFFLALVTASQQFNVSQSFDATNWAVNGAKILSTYADNVVSMIVDHREPWFLGAKASEVEYDSGNLFPFDTVPGGFLEQGCGAAFATVQLDNSIMWIGARNDQGWGIAWRASGYTPVRISNHAVEQMWQSYQTIADARAFSYQDQGHSVWRINFPTAQAGWEYRLPLGMWNEVDYWNATIGAYQAPLPQNHMFLFGKHLVGDRQSGNIYQMSIPVVKGGGWSFATDNGATIRRLRRAPHVATEDEWIFHKRLTLSMETGVGPQPPLLDGAGNPRGPQVTLRWSDDGGHTWSNGYDRDCGKAGEYNKRVIWDRLGRARVRTYELTASDPVPYRIIDAYLKASGEQTEFKPQERLMKQITKVA